MSPLAAREVSLSLSLCVCVFVRAHARARVCSYSYQVHPHPHTHTHTQGAKYLFSTQPRLWVRRRLFVEGMSQTVSRPSGKSALCCNLESCRRTRSRWTSPRRCRLSRPLPWHCAYLKLNVGRAAAQLPGACCAAPARRRSWQIQVARRIRLLRSKHVDNHDSTSGY